MKTLPPPILDGGTPGPIPPATLEDPKPHPSYYEHSFHLDWSYQDLSVLNKIAIESPVAIEAQGSDSDQLFSVVIRIRAETADHGELAAQFADALQNGSLLDSDNPEIRVPEPSCNDSGRYLKGMCLEPIRIRIPKSPLVDLSLAWKTSAWIEGAHFSRLTLILPPTGMARVLDTEGDIELLGGGPDSNLIIDRAGNVDARLDSIADLILEGVTGNFSVAVGQPGPATAIRWNGRWLNAGGLW